MESPLSPPPPPSNKKRKTSSKVLTDSDEEFINDDSIILAKSEDPAILEKMLERMKRRAELSKRYGDEARDEELKQRVKKHAEKKKCDVNNSSDVEMVDEIPSSQPATSGTRSRSPSPLTQLKEATVSAATSAKKTQSSEDDDENDGEDSRGESVVYGKPMKSASPWINFEIVIDKVWSVISNTVEYGTGSFNVVSIRRQPKEGSKSKPYDHNIPQRLLDEHIAALIDIEKKSEEVRVTHSMSSMRRAHKHALLECEVEGISCKSFK